MPSSEGNPAGNPAGLVGARRAVVCSVKGDCHTYHVREGLAREDYARDDLREQVDRDLV